MMNANPKRAERDWPVAVIAGAFQTGVVLMRDLSRFGISVCCIDCNREEPGFRTVYGKAFECPNPDDTPEEWLQFMLDLANKIGGKPVLISTADRFVSAIAAHAEELRGAFLFSHNGASVQALLATKEQQYELAARNGMPVPRSALINSANSLAEFAACARFPCLLKPLHFREWEVAPRNHPTCGKKTLLAGSAAELQEQYTVAAQVSRSVIAQEIIEGPDTAKVVYLSCYDCKGKRIGACIVKELRTFPRHFGSASVVEPCADPEVDALCDRFLQSIGYVGLCEIELKRDSRDGQLKMIEANPRYSGTADAAPYAGVPLGWLHYLDLIGCPVVMVSQNDRDFRHVTLQRDAPTIRAYMQAGELTWRELIRSYRPPVEFYDLDWRDWRLSAETLGLIARAIIGPAIRRVFPRKELSQGKR